MGVVACSPATTLANVATTPHRCVRSKATPYPSISIAATAAAMASGRAPASTSAPSSMSPATPAEQLT